MSEHEKRAFIAYADLKKLILGKFLRTLEYEFSNERFRTKIRTELDENNKIKFDNLLNYLEQSIKDETKRMEV